jgi:adenosylcobinamide kinase/adenosylcobinamide-phosphate guanylyltransferase
MDVRFLGTGGGAGWPQPGCRCASCCRAAAAGNSRRPAAVLIDGRLQIEPGLPPRLADEDGAASGGPAAGETARLTGHRVEPVPGGWDITGPDGARLLVAAGPGLAPEPRAGTRPFDLVLLDLLHSPAQLGALRQRGLVAGDTTAVALYCDHRVSSEQELARRCRFWRAVVPGDGDIRRASAGPEPAGAAGPSPGSPLPHRTLLLGGARSGKSREAELRLAAEPLVTYLAAGPWPDGGQGGAGQPGGGQAGGGGQGGEDGPDAEWAQRVAAHRAARPGWWPTVESTDVAGALGRLRGAVLIDGIGTWLTAVMTEAGAWRPDGADAAPRIAARVEELVTAWRQTGARVVAVSDEVGSSVVPATPAGRQFRDQLGWLNQRLAAESEETALVVAGRVLSLPT